ncbi:uncharacterized protein MELLADRAFT_93135 [Melampsora larici-populina 98AG31]|uniref:Uncharacterized protein n=1 Tax=Melampsora larici-populina (strain 98AG31 / pathotype 3-4-7) TaxID=747676 RepID=F4S419_MELLP|nr:uncharacterized protein MELLADRAFT_93135 [Melampsora larici-populina 98AG31]EGG00628.1 hypothetical protein MELLADRAFT_93135 [Melampsora larici-populina 98AG31]
MTTLQTPQHILWVRFSVLVTPDAQNLARLLHAKDEFRSENGLRLAGRRPTVANHVRPSACQYHKFTSHQSTPPLRFKLQKPSIIMNFPTSEEPPPYITQISQLPIRYQCDVCPHSRSMKFYADHVASPAHSSAVQRFLTRQAADGAARQQFQQELQRDRSPTPPGANLDLNHFFEDLDDDSNPPSIPPSPLTFLRSLRDSDPHGLGGGSDSDDSDMHLDFDRLREAIRVLSTEDFDDEAEEEDQDADALARDLAGVRAEEAEAWYPFKKKEDQTGTSSHGHNTSGYVPFFVSVKSDFLNGEHCGNLSKE